MEATRAQSTPTVLDRSAEAIADDIIRASPGTTPERALEIATEIADSNKTLADDHWRDQKSSVGIVDGSRRDISGAAPSRTNGQPQPSLDDTRLIIRKLLDKPPKPWSRKVLSYLIARVPWTFGIRCPSKVVSERHTSCLTKGPDTTICDALVPGRRFQNAMFCAACGCRESNDSNLARKATMIFASCPRGHWKLPTWSQIFQETFRR